MASDAYDRLMGSAGKHGGKAKRAVAADAEEDKKGKKGKKAKKRKKAEKAEKAALKRKKADKKGPKKKCCASKPRCARCPIRMLAEGRLDPAVARELFRTERNRAQAKKAGVRVPAETG
ncbi:hypothetical protein ACEK07_15890 [Alcanivoracaceae bacterium MT1]